jgi:hypothetical protein
MDGFNFVVLGSHSDVAADSSCLGCYDVSFGKQFLTFRRIIMPSPLGLRRPRRASMDVEGCERIEWLMS